MLGQDVLLKDAAGVVYSPNMAVFSARTFLVAVSAGLVTVVPLIGSMARGISAACPVAATVSSNTAGITHSRRLVMKIMMHEIPPGSEAHHGACQDVGALEQDRDRLALVRRN